MRTVRCLAVALLGFVVAGEAGFAQTTPYFTNVSFADGKVSATLVNTRPTALTAWTVDVIDAGGRSIVSKTTDAIEVPSEFVPARGDREVALKVDAPDAVAIVFRAGIDEKGEGMGDCEIVGRLLKERGDRRHDKAERRQRE